MRDDICFTSAVELAAMIRERSISPSEVVEATLARVAKLDPAIHAFITVTADEARAAAAQAETTLLRDGPEALPPLAGIPIAVKDLTITAGIRTTSGVIACADHVPEVDSPMWARVKAAGPSLLGKSSTPPYGWLGVTENELVGTTNNPWNLDHCAGGSSGGSAAALAAGMGPLATGSDGGGSIRIPAACCGIVGFKPSHGRVPRGAESSRFDTVDTLGPMARTVSDVALLLSVMAGPVEDEPYMLPEEGVDYVADLRAAPVRGLRIAYSPDLGRGPVDSEVAALVAAAARRFERDLGAHVEQLEVCIPDPIEYFKTYHAPALTNFAEDEPSFMDGICALYPSLRALTLPGRTMLAAEHLRVAGGMREETFAAFARIFATHDLLILPTMPLAAFPHAGGTAGAAQIDGQPVASPEIEFHRLTEPFSHTGHPAISIPCGFTRAGLPVGMQIVGRQRDDRAVLRAAAAFEAIAPWAGVRPPL